MLRTRFRSAVPPRPFAPWAPVLLVPAVLLMAGCGDLTGSDEVEIVAAESLAALQFGSELPSLDAALARWGRGLPLDGARNGWKASWERPSLEGRALRTEAIRGAAPALVDRMSEPELGQLLGDFERAVRGVEGISGDSYPAGLVPALEEARALREGARTAFDAGQRAVALEALLLGSDALREVTPSMLASELLGCIEALDRRMRVGDSYSGLEQEIDRIRRLEAGARMALDDGVPILALRRAWYAFRLHQEIEGGPEALSAAGSCAANESFD